MMCSSKEGSLASSAPTEQPLGLSARTPPSYPRGPTNRGAHLHNHSKAYKEESGYSGDMANLLDFPPIIIKCPVKFSF